MRDDPRTRGVLDEATARGVYDARRVLPSEHLADHVAYFWLVRWNLEAPYEQHALTLPAAHYVFEQNSKRSSRAVGPWKRRFTRRLEGRGHIIGVAFHAGLGALWLRNSVSRFVERMVPLSEVLGVELESTHRAVLGAREDQHAIAALEKFLIKHAPVMNAESRLAKKLMDRLQNDRELLRIEQLIHETGMTERQLQRLFSRCVGVSPKSVIRRFRLVEAADALAKPRPPSLTSLAQQLGYFDQPHFIRDFRAVVGRSPKSYARDQ